MLRRASLLAAILFLIPLQASAFESDVHFGLTKWLALKAGYATAQADMIALGNQRTDSGIMDTIELVLEYACLGRHTDAAQVAQKYHFASATKLPALPEQRPIVAGDMTAHREVDKILIAAKSGKADILLLKLGEALHLLQDSWSYQGIPDVPAFEDVPLQCDASLAWAAPKRRGGFDSHKADLTKDWAKDVTAMAASTYETLIQYPAIGGQARVALPWSQVLAQLPNFIKAATKAEKRSWFQLQQIPDTGFLANISLPDGGKRIDESSVDRKLQKLKAGGTLQHNLQAEWKEFFDRFFADWIGSDSPADALGKSSATEQQRDLAGRLKMWRFQDHGAIAELAHSSAKLSKKQLETIDRLSRVPGAYVHYNKVADAFFPLLEQGPGASPLLPYVIHSIAPAKTGNPRLIAVTKFVHAPYDELGLIAERVNGKWQAVRLISVVSH